MKYATFSALCGALLGGLIAAVFGAFWIGAIIGGVLGWLIAIRSINNGNPSSWHLNRHRGANLAIGVQAIVLILAAVSCS